MYIYETLQNEFALGSLLFAEMNRMRKVWASFHPMPPLTRSDLAMLGAVIHLSEASPEPVTVSRLAAFMEQSRPGVSQKVSFLEGEGLLVRVGDLSDRRTAAIKLTEEGYDMARSSLREFLNRVEGALAVMGEEKAEELLSLMVELRQSMEEAQKNKEETG